MKTNPIKAAFAILFIGSCAVVNAQNSQNWSTELNSFPEADKPLFGTATNHALDFYTAGTKKLTLTPDGDLIFVSGSAANGGLVFAEDMAIKSGSYSHDDINENYMVMGKTGAFVPGNVFTIPCQPYGTFNWNVYTGGYISHALGTSPNHTNSKLRLFASETDGNGHIDLDGLNASGTPGIALYLNYHCGKNTNINTGPNGGGVYMGNHVNMKSHLEIGDPVTGVNLAGNVALDIHTQQGTAVLLRTNSNTLDLIRAENAGMTSIPFKVQSDGKTEISSDNADAFVIHDLLNNNYPSFTVHTDGHTELFSYGGKYLSMWNQSSGTENFMFNRGGIFTMNTEAANATDNVFTINAGTSKNFQVKKNGSTAIGSMTQKTGNHSNAMLMVYGKAVATDVIVTQLNWADFVFDKNYELMPLSDVEDFYKKEKHLPNVPTTAQIVENGNDLGQTDAILLQKIEELTLYIVDQQKQINDLKEKLQTK